MKAPNYSTEVLLCFALSMLRQAAKDQSRKGAKPGSKAGWLLENMTLDTIAKRVDEIKANESLRSLNKENAKRLAL